MAKPGKKKKVLFVLEIIVLLLFIGGLYVYGQISSRLDKIEQPELKKEKIVVNQEAPKMTGYKTYVLFGIDTRGEGSQYSAQNSDTMIIVSVNNDTKEVRMVSVYRDTLLNVGDDTYTKANAAYALGGPEQAITMLNTNLDLDISDYATADFSALVEVVDDLGGLDIPLSYAEIEHMNNYCVETSKLTGKGEGCIDVVFLRTLGIDFLPKIMRGFLEENPTKKIDFNLYCDKVLTSDILNGLKEKKYDLGFCSKLDNEPLIEFIPVARQELVVIVPLDHPLAVKDEVRLEDTIPYKQIIFKKRSGLRQIIDGLFECIGQTPDVAYEIDEDQVAAGFVSNGFGICVAPNIPILQSLNVKILPLVSPSWQRNFYMAMLKNVYHPPVVEAFKKYVIEQAQKEWDYKTS